MSHAGAPRIAVVGCGAIAEAFYLPAIAADRRLRSAAVLVDRNPARLADLSHRFGIARTASDYRQVAGEVDAAIVATPPGSHATIAGAFVEQGKPVLVEKPLTETAADGAALVDAAAHRGVPLLVNNTRRLFPTSRYVRDLVSRGDLGRLSRVEYLEGGPFNWPAASSAYFDPGAVPKGVLLDRGAHVLDLVCWWLGRTPEVTTYRDDSLGGPEANCMVTLGAGEVAATIRLSWLVKLPNRWRLIGSNGSVEGDVYDWRTLRLARGGRDGPRTVRVPSVAATFNEYGPILLENLVKVCDGAAEPLVPGADVLPSLALIDRCYSMRQPEEPEWLRYRAGGRA